MTEKQFKAHKYLSQYETCKYKAAELQDKIELFEASVTALCKALSNNESKHTPDENKTELKHAILIDLKADIEPIIKKRIALCDEIEQLIKRVPESELLKWYYIDGETLQDIAIKEDKHEMTIRRHRDKLLDTTYGIAKMNSIELYTTS
jgi:Rad3-related DNA helicase